MSGRGFEWKLRLVLDPFLAVESHLKVFKQMSMKMIPKATPSTPDGNTTPDSSGSRGR